jgi:hypothetical protein
LGGILDLVDSSELAVENEESPKPKTAGVAPGVVVGGLAQSGPLKRWGEAETTLFSQQKFGGGNHEALP